MKTSWRCVTATLSLAVIILTMSAVSGASGGTTRKAANSEVPHFPGVHCAPVGQTPTGPTAVTTAEKSVDRQTLVAVPVCINGHGPYPFLLDTGATTSVISAPLAHLEHLSRHGAPTRLMGEAGCSERTQPIAVANWSLGSVALSSATLQSIATPGSHGPATLGGVLGVDVLARFGAIRIDYDHRSLVVPGPEGPPITGTQNVKGPTGQAVPPGLTSMPSTGTVPLEVVHQRGQVAAAAPVSLGTTPALPFLVDTGSSSSSVSSPVANLAALRSTGRHVRVGTFGCVSTFSEVKTPHWKLGTIPLAPQVLTSHRSQSLTSSIPGILGSDVLRSFGWVVIDYNGAELVLGKRT